MAHIKVRQNGPYLVDVPEDVKLIDWNGNEYRIDRRPFVLCRCGQSQQKPFCDRTHHKIGFGASEPAPEPTPAEPHN